MNIPAQTVRTVELLLAGRAIGDSRFSFFSEHVVGPAVVVANDNAGARYTLFAGARQRRAVEIRRVVKRAQAAGARLWR